MNIIPIHAGDRLNYETNKNETLVLTPNGSERRSIVHDFRVQSYELT